MQKLSYISSFLLLAVVLFSCQQVEKKDEKSMPKTGTWRMEMDLGNKKTLPFIFEWQNKGDAYEMTIINAEEKIIVNEISYQNDTFFLQLPVFDSEFVLTVKDNSTMVGTWNNYYKGPDYKIPVKATLGEQSRFLTEEKDNSSDFDGRYHTIFSPNTEDAGNAIGIFKQNGKKVLGTFATERGDYRHLEGNIVNDKIMLSTFDGSHAFLFSGEKKNDTIYGKFYSGTHWEEDWIAIVNDTFQLRNADSLTFIKEDYDGISFEFPNSAKNLVSLNDDRYKDKVVIVQIMGTWCPNCLDETLYLAELYKNHKDKGLEIIALAFERTKTEEKAFNNIVRLKDRTNATYEILLGGATRDDKASDKLPMLNHVMSYPTAIFLDKQKNVRRIHTGFYGPSTGKYYDDFTTKTEALVVEMLNE